MKKNLYIFFLILLLSCKECSKCTEFKPSVEKESSSSGSGTGNNSGSESEAEESSSSGSGTGDSNDSEEDAEESSSSESEAEESNNSEEEEKIPLKRRIRRRRLNNKITNTQYKDLETSDNNKYKCVVNSNHTGCEEVKKEESKKLRTSLIILILLFVL